jgi:prefoldin subunit 5
MGGPPGGMPGPMDQGGMPSPTEVGQEMPPMGGRDGSKERIEEMAEAIIDEKWEELVKSINKIIEWKEKMDGSINKIQQEITDMKENFDRLHSSVVGKIDEYDKNIVNVGTEVKAMEKVFEKALPAFTENVGELRRIVKSAKK